MREKDEAFRKRLFATFAAEAAEHLRALSSLLIKLEQPEGAVRPDLLVEAAFREAHSLKGAAGAVDAKEVASLCRGLENLFATLKSGDVKPLAGLLDTVHEALNLLRELLSVFESGLSPSQTAQLPDLLGRLDILARTPLSGPVGEIVPADGAKHELTHPPPEADRSRVADDGIRVSAAKLDRLLLQAEEMLSGKLAASRLAAEARAVLVVLKSHARERAGIEADLRLLRQAGKNGGSNDHKVPRGAVRSVFEFLEGEAEFQKTIEAAVAALVKATDHNARALGRSIDVLREETKKLRMLPFSSLFETFPWLVRNISREQRKEVDLVLEGGEIEVDRRILEGMKDAFIHLLRNCVDHGIEKPEERLQSGKTETGAITLTVSQKESNRVEVVVADDGKGIDLARLQVAGQKRGFPIDQQACAYSENEVLSLIFESGLSTSPVITDISGRGLGLAIARERVEKLGGTIAVESTGRQGTVFRIVLPVSVAALRGVLVRTGTSRFILPISWLDRVVRVRRRDIQTVENRETIQLNGQALGLALLADLLNLPPVREGSATPETLAIAVIRWAGKRVGVIVDEVIAEQEILVKTLGPHLRGLPSISGATILGDGEVVPILAVGDLVKRAVRNGFKTASVLPPKREGDRPRKQILVVEDSITARVLLRNILEAAGYDVKTAVDGIDALTTLRTIQADLVVSDVDMPRLSGLELTARIRADKTFAELPVVLVTALESREDRERGIEVGANAYIVKSTFEQGNLLEVIRQLI